MPDDDFYGSDPEPSTSDDTKESGGDDSEKGFLINKNVCAGMKPGEEMVVVIDRVLEDEYLVHYAPKKEGGDEGSYDKPSEPDDEASMDSMFA